jgi:hypothetical protein
MLKTFRFGPDTRVAVLDLGDGANVAMTSGTQRLVAMIPLPVVNTLADELDACRRGGDRAGRPSPPRYKWPQLMARLNRDALTESDRDVIRDLLFRMGVTA